MMELQVIRTSPQMNNHISTLSLNFHKPDALPDSISSFHHYFWLPPLNSLAIQLHPNLMFQKQFVNGNNCQLPLVHSVPAPVLKILANRSLTKTEPIT